MRKLRNNIGKKNEKTVYRIWRVCYTRQGVSRFSVTVNEVNSNGLVLAFTYQTAHIQGLDTPTVS